MAAMASLSTQTNLRACLRPHLSRAELFVLVSRIRPLLPHHQGLGLLHVKVAGAGALLLRHPDCHASRLKPALEGEFYNLI